MPSESDIVAVSMCGASTAWTEVAAKAALLAGSQQVIEVAERLGGPRHRRHGKRRRYPRQRSRSAMLLPMIDQRTNESNKGVFDE
ncbi:MAG: hypothetical protein R2710_18740 [Acidimicrobiales bacterium]